MYSNGSIERVRGATDIATVVGRYVKLKRSGKNLKGLCPFHREKTPSFIVSPDRQAFHCFGCGVGGDVFSFLMKYLNYSFTEALEELASESGIALEKTGRNNSSRNDALKEILEVSRGFFESRLHSTEGRGAMDYLESRFLSPETIETLGIGWAPDGNPLYRFLRKKGFSDSRLEEAGVALRSRKGGGMYDRFRRRIIFPISDRRGRVVSFGGRFLGDSDGNVPKYLNGPDSPVYVKGNHLYGFGKAVRAARELDMVILVEGYFDHARFVELGFDCVTATCGTALTSNQARRIMGLTPSIYICYDGDDAGRKASVRAAEIFLEQGCLPKIMAVPGGSDPDDFLRDKPGDAVFELAENAVDPVTFALDLVGGWDSVRDPQRRVKVVRRLAEMASKAVDPVVRETLVKIISSSTGYSERTVATEIEEIEAGNRPGRRRRRNNLESKEMPGWDASILGCLAGSPEGLEDPLVGFLREEDLKSFSARKILAAMKEQAAEGLKEFQVSVLPESERNLYAGLMAGRPAVTNPDDSRRIMRAVKRARLLEERRRLRESLAGDTGENSVDRKRIAELEARLKELRE